MKVGILCYIFWGASAMWLVDAFFAYEEIGKAYFMPSAADMLNDLFLGLAVSALALVIWVAVLLFTDPRGVGREVLLKQGSEHRKSRVEKKK